ncbi:MAG: type II toxin-antitoxin system HicA family toxin [Flavobacteriales bacterium]|nr:type II toxin-antitoxin system HicA family toxin [Flavobacteriales bacterium]MEB2342394.1 type II toxin-antitoxin system HicA family toxin [Flavobacteriia bacterium]
MNLPRNITGRQLAKALEKLGYTITRQKGSHIHITTTVNGEHHVTIPDHRPLKVGTLSAVLRDVGTHHQLERDALVRELF